MPHRISVVPLDPAYAPSLEQEEALVRQLIADGVVEETLDGYVSGMNLRLFLRDRDNPDRDAAGLKLQIKSFPQPRTLVGKNTFELKLKCGHTTSWTKLGEAPYTCPECARELALKDIDFGNAGAFARFEISFVGETSYSLLVRRPYLDKIGSLLGCRVKWIHLES